MPTDPPPDLDSLETAIDQYCECWARVPSEQRISVLKRVLAHDVTYSDPTVLVRGIEGLNEHIEDLLSGDLGSRVVRTSVVDLHHRRFRFAWQKVMADGRRLPESIDFGEIRDDGFILSITGFFGPLRGV